MRKVKKKSCRQYKHQKRFHLYLLIGVVDTEVEIRRGRASGSGGRSTPHLPSKSEIGRPREGGNQKKRDGPEGEEKVQKQESDGCRMKRREKELHPPFRCLAMELVSKRNYIKGVKAGGNAKRKQLLFAYP